MFCLWKDPELFYDYDKLNENSDETIRTDDAKFYYALGRQLYRQGFRSFDDVTVYTYLEDKPTVREHFETMGGYRTVEELRNLVNTDNVTAYFDRITKGNMLLSLYDKGFSILPNIQKFNQMTSQEVYDYYDYLLNHISIRTSNDLEIESLELDDKFLDDCDQGQAQGISYGKACPILNYLTLGLPLGELYMIGGHSGIGKTSVSFESMIMPIARDGGKCVVISNEQRSKDFKMLLAEHILTWDMNYWGLTRKALKQGNFTPEQKEKLREAQQIRKERYADIKFAKLFDTDMAKVKRIIKKFAKQGYQTFLFDTMKSEDEVDEAMWLQLLIHSRKLFQVVSRENVAMICTYQLALHTLNKRYLDASCLSNAKQIKEVFSEMVYMRPLWDDEYTGEKYDVKPYQLKKDESGKYTKIREMIDLDPTKKYVVAFLDKSRNDETGIQVLYETNLRFNRWKELGYCHVTNTRQ